MALFLGFKPVPIGPRRAAASRLAQVSSKPTELLSWLLAVRLMPSVWRQFLTEGPGGQRVQPRFGFAGSDVAFWPAVLAG
jgi:hypothetical protein